MIYFSMSCFSKTKGLMSGKVIRKYPRMGKYAHNYNTLRTFSAWGMTDVTSIPKYRAKIYTTNLDTLLVYIPRLPMI